MSKSNEIQSKKEKPSNPKREALIEKSIFARQLRDSDPNLEEMTINELVIENFYADEENTEFNTFRQWKEQGAVIKKGSASFPVWGQPIKAKDPKINTEGMSEEEKEKAKYKYWPICHLFSNAQIIFPKEENSKDDQERAKPLEKNELVNENILEHL